MSLCILVILESHSLTAFVATSSFREPTWFGLAVLTYIGGFFMLSLFLVVLLVLAIVLFVFLFVVVVG